jgi:hypothetical protein
LEPALFKNRGLTHVEVGAIRGTIEFHKI